MISFSQTHKKHSMDFSNLKATIEAEDMKDELDFLGENMEATFKAYIIAEDLDNLCKIMIQELNQQFPECSRAFLRTLNTKYSEIKELKKVNRDFCVDELKNKYKNCLQTWKKLKNEDTCSHLRRD